MPTERFYRLPEDKKKAIIHAALREFIRVPYEKASINQMIREAGISRGSFYTYFEDKRDLLCCIFQDIGRRLLEFCRESLKDNGGDFWETMESLLVYSMKVTRDNDLFRLSRNVMMYHGLDRIQEGPGCPHKSCDHEKMAESMIETFFENIDRSQFKIQTREEFELLMELAMSSTMMALSKFYQNPDHAEKIKKLFHEKLEILRHGVCK